MEVEVENEIKPMRVCSKMSDILEIFENIKTGHSMFTVWQNMNGYRYRAKAYIYNIDAKNGTLAIKPAENSKFKFEKPFTIYIYGNEISLLFKATSNLTLNNMIIINVPTEIRLIEKRTNPRILFSGKYIESMVYKKTGYNEEHHTLTLRILDISQGGMALVVYSHDLALFSKDSKIYLTKVSNMAIEPEVEGVVVYARSISKDKNTASKSFRVGVKFFKEIDQSTIMELSTT